MKAQAESRQTLVLGVYAREFPGGLSSVLTRAKPGFNAKSLFGRITIIPFGIGFGGERIIPRVRSFCFLFQGVG